MCSSDLLMGVLLLATVMLAPQGFVLGIGKLVVDWWTRRRRRDEAPALWRALGVPPGVDVSAAEVPQVRALRAR